MTLRTLDVVFVAICLVMLIICQHRFIDITQVQSHVYVIIIKLKLMNPIADDDVALNDQTMNTHVESPIMEESSEDESSRVHEEPTETQKD